MNSDDDLELLAAQLRAAAAGATEGSDDTVPDARSSANMAAYWRSGAMSAIVSG